MNVPRLLLKVADLIEKNAEELAELETLDNGKAIFGVENYREEHVPASAESFRYYAGWATKIYGETNPSPPNMFNYTLREPVGVCGQIIPWNFPLLMASWKIAPALACGNVVILKPAEQTPLTALRLGELLMEAGIPEGVVNIITGFGPGAGGWNRRPSGCRQGRVYRLDRGRQGDPQGLSRELEARVAGAGRQVGQHHFPRCGFAVGGAQLDAGHLHDPGQDLMPLVREF